MKRNIAIVFCSFFLTTLAYAGGPKILDFLVRDNYLTTGQVAKANNYRIKNYTMIRYTKFMGKPIALNSKVIPALKCVERRIKASCSADTYTAKYLSGWRPNNTIKGNEISNHVFGIAIDIDPQRNPCCGCVKDWAKAERCSGEGVVEHQHGPSTGRYDLPQCWIDAFKSNGWYWLGDDKRLRDTMHFEFLADPNTISCN